jgi:hypothetical protein
MLCPSICHQWCSLLVNRACLPFRLGALCLGDSGGFTSRCVVVVDQFIDLLVRQWESQPPCPCPCWCFDSDAGRDFMPPWRSSRMLPRCAAAVDRTWEDVESLSTVRRLITSASMRVNLFWRSMTCGDCVSAGNPRETSCRTFVRSALFSDS